MKILISDKLAKEGVDILEATKGFEVDCKFGIKPEELKAIIKDYDALIIRSGRGEMRWTRFRGSTGARTVAALRAIRRVSE